MPKVRVFLRPPALVQGAREGPGDGARSNPVPGDTLLVRCRCGFAKTLPAVPTVGLRTLPPARHQAGETTRWFRMWTYDVCACLASGDAKAMSERLGCGAGYATVATDRTSCTTCPGVASDCRAQLHRGAWARSATQTPAGALRVQDLPGGNVPFNGNQ
jgi:hypothetical protein